MFPQLFTKKGQFISVARQNGMHLLFYVGEKKKKNAQSTVKVKQKGLIKKKLFLEKRCTKG